MTGMTFYGVLLAVGLMAIFFFKNNNTFMLVVSLIVGAIVIYSHETGKGAADLKRGIHDTIDNPAKQYERKFSTEAFKTDNNLTYK